MTLSCCEQSGISFQLSCISIQMWYRQIHKDSIFIVTYTCERYTIKEKQYRHPCESESQSVVSVSLRAHGLCSPWNPPGQITGVGGLSLLHWIFPTQESNWASCIAGGFFTNWALREAQTAMYSPPIKISGTLETHLSAPWKVYTPSSSDFPYRLVTYICSFI